MFRLNEAPNKVISTICCQESARNCGTFWSILCCIPTCGYSIYGNESRKDWRGCCYPRSVSQDTHVSLDVLVDKLNKLRMKEAEIHTSEDKDMRRKVIEWQVKETIELLETVIEENIIQGSYRSALSTTLNAIKVKAIQDEKYAKVLSKHTIPLPSHEMHVPAYGMVSK